MFTFKHLHKVAVLSALVLYGFSATPANAATTVPVATPAGACVGDATHDCVTTTGHISASVVTTLSINEKRAVSFGNMAVTCANPCTAGARLDMTAAGARSVANGGGDAFVLLHGNSANDGVALIGAAGGADAGHANSGGQAPGIYSVTTGAEGGAVQVYIAFADASGNFIDYSGETYYPAANAVNLTRPAGTATFNVNKFVIACNSTAGAALVGGGSDVYGHYCPTDGAGNVNVYVGASLNTDTSAVASYLPGRYTGTYNVMVSY